MMDNELERFAECNAFVSTLPIGVLILDEDSNIIIANQAMEVLCGYPVAHLHEMNVRDLIPEGVSNPHAGKLSTVIKNGGGPRQMKPLSAVPMKRRDGVTCYVDVERFVYKWPDGSRRFAGMITPVSNETAPDHVWLPAHR